MIHDLIVVGSGSVGAAAGFYAARAGLSVLMLDGGRPPHTLGTHHGQTRLIRHAYGEGARYVPLVLRAQALWDELECLGGARIMHRSGILNLAPRSSRFIGNVIDSAKTWRLEVDILQADEVRRRWPRFQVPDGYVGVFEPHSGYLECEQAVRSYLELAARSGAAQRFDCPVSALGRKGDLQRVVTAEGEFLARRLLVSAGTWVGRLLPGLPVAPVRKVFSWHRADDRYGEAQGFPGFTVEMADGGHFYGFPATVGTLKVGRHDGGQPMRGPQDRLPFGGFAEDADEASEFLQRFLPGVGECVRGEACSYDNSPDEDFIVDTVPGDPDRLLVAGLSGHGFKFASVLGELACEFARGTAFSFNLAPFSLARFG